MNDYNAKIKALKTKLQTMQNEFDAFEEKLKAVEFQIKQHKIKKIHLR